MTPKIAQIPFSQALKRKSVVRNVKDNNKIVRVYIKGAPEYVVPMCTQTMGKNIKPKNIDSKDHSNILNRIVSGEMASQGLKVLTYAFK